MRRGPPPNLRLTKRGLQAERRRILAWSAGMDWPRARALAARIRNRLIGRVHVDSAELIGSDREAR